MHLSPCFSCANSNKYLFESITSIFADLSNFLTRKSRMLQLPTPISNVLPVGLVAEITP